MQSISRSFLLRLGLTLLALAAAMHLQVPKLSIRPADATSTCPNTSCYGPTLCYYSAGEACAIGSRTGPCTVSNCQ
jgi:hypothetical protein